MQDKNELIEIATDAIISIQYGVHIAQKILPDLQKIRDSYDFDSEEWADINILVDELEYYV